MNLKLFLLLNFIVLICGFHGNKGKHNGLFKDMNLDDNQRNRIDEIFKNKDLTKNQQDQQLSQLFNEFGLSEKYQELQNQKQSKLDDLTSKISSANLSPDAQSFANSFLTILKNNEITRADEKEQIKQLLDTTSDEIKNELKEKIDGNLFFLKKNHKMHKRNHGKFNPLFFLTKDLNDEQKAQVDAVVQNTGLTKQQMDDQLRPIFEGFGLAQQFQEFVNKKNEKMKNMTDKINEIKDTLSPEAQQAIQKGLDTMNNPSLTIDALKTQLENLKNETPENVQTEIKNALKSEFHGSHLFGMFGGKKGRKFNGSGRWNKDRGQNKNNNVDANIAPAINLN